MVTDLDSTLAALADPTRRRIVELLRERPRRAGELAAEFAVTAPAVSRHLRVLRRAGLITDQVVETDARLRVYQLRREPLVALQAWVDQVQAFWADQLGAFKELAEQRPVIERYTEGGSS
ncbi:transcriptional regulator [Virgisporangium aliadipatigenens]|uniref:Transcriptional regulator n=1 Tax=Virgisporangium aliadipatigenens TaxID=741659 RepID=A0A8J4DN96_9ACTN|nr:metalloregulator ArsR/SmtB family transcription factor [Virgisporangium aliadipatigenens]GIJ44650.1 transcriptional regulator [Virgisporangium aliadipatigenens]